MNIYLLVILAILIGRYLLDLIVEALNLKSASNGMSTMMACMQAPCLLELFLVHSFLHKDILQSGRLLFLVTLN